MHKSGVRMVREKAMDGFFNNLQESARRRNVLKNQGITWPFSKILHLMIMSA
jgi:hypothetical protein